MNIEICCCFLVMCVSSVFSVTISTPALQRRNIGDSCTIRWVVTGNFTAYNIKLLSTGSTGTAKALGPNTNQTFDSKKATIKLFIWNIQLTNAGYYSLSVSAGPTEVNSVVVLFVYSNPTAYITLAAGRNPSYDGDKIELNCTVTTSSLPVEYRTKMYYFWYNSYYGGFFRNTSNGPAVLQNGDILPGYSIKNDGKTMAIASAQYLDRGFTCYFQEEGSPYKFSNYNSLTFVVYSRPYTYSFNPVNRKLNAPPSSYIYLNFYYQSNPPLTSYSNWSFVSTSGSITEYPVSSNLLLSPASGPVTFALTIGNPYGNYSITLSNSNGSRTETFEVLPLGPPDTPSNFSVQYLTSSSVSLQWRCMWFNGAQQIVFIRLTDSENDEEIETQAVTLITNCYNSAYGTLFQSSIQPETDYEASIWSNNSLGPSDVMTLQVKTPKRFIFDVSPANISIMGALATIRFSITESTKLLWLNITCCAELTTQCSNQSYIVPNSNNQILYDKLPDGAAFVFDFIVYDTDIYTYMYNLAIVKGVRVSREGYLGPGDNDHGKENSLLIAVIVLAVLLGIALLALLGCCIVFLVCKCRQDKSHQQSAAVSVSTPARPKPNAREPSVLSNGEDFYEPVVDFAPSNENTYYKSLN